MRLRLKSDKNTPNKIPTAHHDPKTKKITVTYYYGSSKDIIAKLIIHRGKWMHLWEELDFTNVKFRDVESFLSLKTSLKTKEVLKQYSEKYPDHFSADIYNCVHLANFENPDFRPPKPRKPSLYELNKAEKWEISNTAIRLYLYLRHISKQQEKSWPHYLAKFLKSNNIPKANLYNDLILKQDIKDVMSEYYSIEFGDRFWQTFVTESPISLTRLKDSSRVFTPESDKSLAELFKEFMD